MYLSSKDNIVYLIIIFNKNKLLLIFKTDAKYFSLSHHIS